MYEAKISPKGTVTYNAPTGCTDDTVIALMLSLEAKKIYNKKGNYSIAFV
jgi:hypothetical protein